MLRNAYSKIAVKSLSLFASALRTSFRFRINMSAHSFLPKRLLVIIFFLGGGEYRKKERVLTSVYAADFVPRQYQQRDQLQ